MNKKTMAFFKIVFFAFAMLLAFEVIGQSRQLSFGGGLNLCALRDQATSPLIYSGTGFDGFISYRSTSERKETVWLISAGSANLSSVFDRNLKTIGIRLTNLNLYSHPDNDAKFQWGWSNNNGFHHRLIDDLQNFNGRVNFFTTFGPATKFNLPFRLGDRQFKFQTAAHVQLIGIYLPSGYVASYPAGFVYEPNSFAEAVVESMKIFHPGSAFNGAFWPQLEWQLETGNSIALNYLYEFTHFRKPHRTARSSGHWFLTFNMTL